MGQGQREKAPPAALILALALAGSPAPAPAQLGIITRAVTTSMDVRTRDEVKADTEISAGISKRLLDDKGSEWKGVTSLVFAQHVVLAGAVSSDKVRKRVEEVAKADKRIRAFRSELLVGDAGSLARDTALEAEINARLTAEKGVGSVNMRWCATGGRVVVMGVARSQQEASVAVQKIRGVKGVKSVVSHLRVVPQK